MVLNLVLSQPVVLCSDEYLCFQCHYKRFTTLLLLQLFVDFFGNSNFLAVPFFGLFQFSLFLSFPIFHTAFVYSPLLKAFGERCMLWIVNDIMEAKRDSQIMVCLGVDEKKKLDSEQRLWHVNAINDAMQCEECDVR